jgi:hypothetical protein
VLVAGAGGLCEVEVVPVELVVAVLVELVVDGGALFAVTVVVPEPHAESSAQRASAGARAGTWRRARIGAPA